MSYISSSFLTSRTMCRTCRSHGIRESRWHPAKSQNLYAIPSLQSSSAAEKNRPGLAMCSFMLQPGEDKIVADQLSRVLREHSA